jgi:hypothetical protein
MITGMLAAGPAGAAGAAALKAFGPAGFNKLADWLVASQAGVRAALASVVEIAMPFFMMFAAIMQIMMKGEYEQLASQQALGTAGKLSKITGKPGEEGLAAKAVDVFKKVKKKVERVASESNQRLQRIDEEISLLESNMRLRRGKMRISESALRRVIREELESIERGKRLIVQDDEVDEQEFGATPDATNEDDFQKIRLARLKASGVSGDDAERMSRSKLKHRGARPGRG